MPILHATDIDKAVQGYMNIKRLKLIGYGDSQVTSLTTVASLKTSVETFRDSVALHQSQRAICDAAVDSIMWAASVDYLDTTIVTALTTVATDSTSATTDLSYNFYSMTGFPTASVPRAANDLTTFFPAVAA